MKIVGKIDKKEIKFNIPDMASTQEDSRLNTLYDRVNNIENNVHDIKTLLFGVMVLLSVIFVVVILNLIKNI